jgi:hypothetical protein
MNWHASFSAGRKIKICLPGREHAILFFDYMGNEKGKSYIHSIHRIMK